MTTEPDFSKLLKEGYRFDIGYHLGNGWKLFSKGAGSYIGFILLFFVMYFASGVLTTLVWPPLFLGVLLLITPLFSGVFVFTRQLTKDHHEFGDFFKGFQQFGQITMFYIVLMLITSPLIIFYFGYLFPYELYIDSYMGRIDDFTFAQELSAHMESRIEYLWLVLIVFYAGGIYVSVSYAFALPLIVDAKLGFWQAMETSRKAAAMKFFSIFALFLVVGLLSMVGIFITCGIGFIAAVPFTWCVIFSAYDGIFTAHLNSAEEDIDSFGTGAIDGNTETDSEN